VNKINFIRIECADKEGFKTPPKQSLAYTVRLKKRDR